MSQAAHDRDDRLSSEDLAQAILNELQVVVVHAGTDLKIASHSPGLRPYLPTDHEDAIDVSLPDLFPELIDSEEELKSVVRGVLPRFDLPMINRTTPHSDERRYLSLTALPHPQNPDSMVLLVQDVTTEGRLDQQVTQQLNEARLLRARLEAANKELVRLDREKSAFLRLAAHDLRAPLSVVRGYVELVVDDREATSDEEAAAYLIVVLNRTQQMANLIDNLLDIEKIESGGVSLERESQDLGLMVEQVARGFVLEAKDKGQTLEWTVPPDSPHALVDADRIVQVLNNLVSNALKFTPEGGRVRIEVLHKEDELFVEVTDTGPGISANDQARLFERFFRTDEARQRRIPGTGLGLSIVRSIIEQHGGKVYCRSQLAQGSTFGFRLPIE